MIKRLESVHKSVFGTIELEFFDDEIFKRSFSKECFYSEYQKPFYCNSNFLFDVQAVGKMLELKTDLDSFIGTKSEKLFTEKIIIDHNIPSGAAIKIKDASICPFWGNSEKFCLLKRFIDMHQKDFRVYLSLPCYLFPIEYKDASIRASDLIKKHQSSETNYSIFTAFRNRLISIFPTAADELDIQQIIHDKNTAENNKHLPIVT